MPLVCVGLLLDIRFSRARLFSILSRNPLDLAHSGQSFIFKHLRMSRLSVGNRTRGVGIVNVLPTRRLHRCFCVRERIRQKSADAVINFAQHIRLLRISIKGLVHALVVIRASNCLLSFAVREKS